MNNNKRIYILGEEHPQVLRGIAAFQLIMVLKDLDTLLEEQNKTEEAYNPGYSQLRELAKTSMLLASLYNLTKNPPNMSYLQNLMKEVENLLIQLNYNGPHEEKIKSMRERLLNSIQYYVKSYKIEQIEYGLLEELLSKQEFKTAIIYHEGGREGIEKGRPDILGLAERYKAKIIPLDEGNLSYESFNKYLESLIYSLKNSINVNGVLNFNNEKVEKELEELMKVAQKEREDLWIRRISQTAEDGALLIAIVGKNHINPDCEHCNKLSIGNFAKKLEKEGFEVKIIDVTQILERLEKELS
jgi:hypothetical protein